MTCDLTHKAVPKETVGAASSRLLEKSPEANSPIEQMYESLTDYDKNMYECIQRGKKSFSGDFFVEVITKKEPLMPNVIRNYFIPRLSCPTPNYDQTVYKITPQNDQIWFIWVIPDRQTCHIFIENKTEIVPEEYGLLDFVLKFERGDLFKLSKELNGEIA